MRPFSPRQVVEHTLLDGTVPADRGIWQCMNCGMCTEVCQNGVRFHEYIRTLRPELALKLQPQRNHGAVPYQIMSLNARAGIVPNRQRWILPGQRTDDDSETLLFVGCTPYLDILFRYLRLDLLGIPRSALTLLNQMDISPRVIRDERCCGHDAYWEGDDELFEKLVHLNVEAFDRVGTSTVVTFCPECASSIRDLYPRVVGPLGFEVRTLLEVLTDGIEEGKIELRRDGETLTYHDPCRLGRHLGVYEPPRKIVSSLGSLTEMPRSRQLGPCCGVSGWMECGAETRPWQMERLAEAAETGASRMVTACPKCLIHLSCAMSENLPLLPRAKLPLVDIHVLAESRLAR